MGNDFKLSIKAVPRPEPAKTEPEQVVQEARSLLAHLIEKPKTVGMVLALIALIVTLLRSLAGSGREATEFAMIDSDLNTVSARIMGYVKSVNVNEGDSVKAGDVLANLDTNEFLVEERVKSIKFQKASHDLQRAKMMAESSGISKSDFELAQLNFSANEADLEATHLKLKYTEIQTPISGRIAKRSIQTGQFIQPGQTLFVIVPDGKIWVAAKFNESQISRIEPGLRAVVRVSAIHKEYEGQVRAINPVTQSKLSILPTESTTGNLSHVVQRFSVLIDLRESGPELRPGMSATAEIYVH